MTTVDELIGNYLRRYPGADQASTTDATFHVQVRVFQKLLRLVEMAMADEEIPEETRLRVMRTALAGAADVEDAARRQDEYARRLADIQSAPATVR